MTTESDRRERSAAILRAMADLIEQHPEVKEPHVRADWYFQGANPADAMRLAAGVYPEGTWTSGTSDSGEYAWLNLEAGTAASSVSGPGVHLKVGADARAACEEAGSRTVTIWKPSPEIADLITGEVKSGD